MPRRDLRSIFVLFSLISFLGLSPRASADTLPERDRAWLEEVDPLVTKRERDVFTGLRAETEREAFIEGFWQARDPFPQTPRNELREEWESRLTEAQRRFGGLADDRSRVFLLRGSPTSSFQADCPGAGDYEVWVYEPRFRDKLRTVLVFRRGAEGVPARLWRPGQPGFDPAAVNGAACTRGGDLAREAGWIRAAGREAYGSVVERALARPRPREWISSFVPLSFEPSDGAPKLDAGLAVDFAGRQQDKIVVRVLLTVPSGSLARPGVQPAHDSGGDHEFLLAGRVMRGGQPFESFLYRFRARPQRAAAGEPIPLTFERYLPPGSFTLEVKLEHVPSQSVFLGRREIDVPELLTASAPAAVPAMPAVPAVLAAQPAAEPAPAPAPELAGFYAEADAALSVRRPGLRLAAPAGVLIGPVRFEAQLDGAADAVARVAFALDGKPLLTRTRPPFELRVDLGLVPRPQKLVAEGLSADGSVVARDQLLVNAGVQPLRVRLREPQAGKPYRRSVRAVVDVDAPAGARVERVELYLGEERVATLYQPPFTQPILLPKEGAVDYVRAVAWLADGGRAEDAVLINAPEAPDKIDVRMVELYATVMDGQGRPVTTGLDDAAFRVVEDGAAQQVRRVETVAETPLRLVTLIDSSGSMMSRMAAVKQAALEFLHHVMRPRDEAAVITFNNVPRVIVPLTSEKAVLDEGFDDLVAGADTALWDSLVYSLFYLNGTKGQRAVLLLSDGEDRVSRFGYEQALESARRAGVAVYPVGLALDKGAYEAADRLSRLAAATGGRAFFLKDTAELPGVYAQIERELRAQWRIAYQSSNTGSEGAFRTVQLKVAKPGLEARTISGYYP
jgi:VWFA-related protein